MSEYLDLWLRASKAEFGICVATDNVKTMEAYLYNARKDHPELRSIRIVLLEEGAVWLVKDTVTRLDNAGATR